MRARRSWATVDAAVRSSTSLDRLRALARNDPATAAGLGVALATGCALAGFSVAELAVAPALAAPLAWRSRWPLRVLAAVAVASLAFVMLVRSEPVFVPPLAVALYAAALQGSRWDTVALATGLVPYIALMVTVSSFDDGSDLQQAAELGTQLGLALAVGEAVRSGRALIAASRERAELARQEQERDALRRVDEERLRIARDVHDVVAHSLATISTQASVGVHLGRRDPERGVVMLESIKEVAAEALQELRQALGTLRDDAAASPTRPAPGLLDLPELVEQARGSGLPVALQVEGPYDGVPGAVQVTAFRIVQEGLTNVMRHARGARASVHVTVSQSDVEVDVTDDGEAPPSAPAKAPPGSGLLGMRERVGALGGTLEAGHVRGGGFEVHAVLPREHPGA